MLNLETFTAEIDARKGRFISTMETETISSRNVVDLMLDEAFNTGICGPAKSVEDDLGRPNVDNLDEFVYGWDC